MSHYAIRQALAFLAACIGGGAVLGATGIAVRDLTAGS